MTKLTQIDVIRFFENALSHGVVYCNGADNKIMSKEYAQELYEKYGDNKSHKGFNKEYYEAMAKNHIGEYVSDMIGMVISLTGEDHTISEIIHNSIYVCPSFAAEPHSVFFVTDGGIRANLGLYDGSGNVYTITNDGLQKETFRYNYQYAVYPDFIDYDIPMGSISVKRDGKIIDLIISNYQQYLNNRNVKTPITGIFDDSTKKSSILLLKRTMKEEYGYTGTVNDVFDVAFREFFDDSYDDANTKKLSIDIRYMVTVAIYAHTPISTGYLFKNVKENFDSSINHGLNIQRYQSFTRGVASDGSITGILLQQLFS